MRETKTTPIEELLEFQSQEPFDAHGAQKYGFCGSSLLLFTVAILVLGAAPRWALDESGRRG